MKDLLATLNQTAIHDTHRHVHLEQRKIAEGRGLDRDLDQDVLGQVRPTPGQIDPGVREGHGLIGRTIMIQIGGHTGALHAERGGDLALVLTETGTVQNLKMTTERIGPERLNLVDHLPTQARRKTQNHLPT